MKIDAKYYNGSRKLLCPTQYYVNQNTVPTLAFNTQHGFVALLWSYYSSLCVTVYYQLICLFHSCMLMKIRPN